MSRVADPRAKIALLRAAEEVFADRGVTGAKVEDIAHRAGLSKGAFYLHFESKDAALKQIVETWLARCGSLFAGPSDYPDMPVDPDGLLDFCIQRDVQIYEFLWQSRTTMRILHGCQGDYQYMFDAFRVDMRRRNREWLALWRHDGLIRVDTNVELAAILMSGAHEALSLAMTTSEKRPPFEDWVEFAQTTFVRAYGTAELLAALERRNDRSNTGIHELRRSPGPGNSQQRTRARGRG